MLAWGRKGVKLTLAPDAPSRALRIARWLPALFWMAGIAYVSHQSSPPGAADGGQSAAGAHLMLYAVLAFALWWPLSRDYTAPAWLPASFAFALAVLFGVTDELHHALVPGRVASLGDLGLDAAGAAIGVIAAGVATLASRLLRAH